MFSNMIQGLLSTSGQQAAQQRAVQLQSSVYNATNNIPTRVVSNTSPATSAIPFQEVLQETAQSDFGTQLSSQLSSKFATQFGSQFGSLLTTPNATTNVQAQISVQPELRGYAQPSKPQLLDMISKISQKHGVDEKLVKALVKQESGFNPKAKSHCGAMGLMQLMPGTAKTLGVKDAFNPVQNVDGGVRHLKWLLSKYNGNVVLALAAYNAGSGAVDKYDGIPPYKETQNYVKNILKNYLS